MGSSHLSPTHPYQKARTFSTRMLSSNRRMLHPRLLLPHLGQLFVWPFPSHAPTNGMFILMTLPQRSAELHSTAESFLSALLLASHHLVSSGNSIMPSMDSLTPTPSTTNSSPSRPSVLQPHTRASPHVSNNLKMIHASSFSRTLMENR